jgi:hypothetical protein
MGRVAGIAGALVIMAGVTAGSAAAFPGRSAVSAYQTMHGNAFKLTAVTSRDGPAGIARASASNCQPLTGTLVALVQIHNLSAQVLDCYVAASGPAPVIALLSGLAKTLGFGNVAYYDQDNEQGNGLIVFVGNNDNGCTVFGVTGDTAVNFEDSTDQSWVTSNSGHTKVDADDQAGTDQNISPTTDFAFAPASVGCKR